MKESDSRAFACFSPAVFLSGDGCTQAKPAELAGPVGRAAETHFLPDANLKNELSNTFTVP